MISKKWLEFAREDYRVLEYLWKSKSKFYRSICFHGQQYVENISFAIFTPTALHITAQGFPLAGHPGECAMRKWPPYPNGVKQKMQDMRPFQRIVKPFFHRNHYVAGY
ncbi:MAG: hypothetical protein CV087_09885 [Candidatus Brocadia sp. WS118]|nr:MAG: hypothetical protein CV087_09885 [Candidatus Brocadia sp. WS118]